MLKKFALITLAAGVILAVGYADQAKHTVIQVDRTSPADGKQMYTSYCAPCHGMDGRGNGPAAQALKSQPIDLTVLARNNHGKYPDTHVNSVLHFGSEIPSHGNSQMPIWGPILGKMTPSNSMDKDLRIANLSRYLEHMQVK
jgi:mono/diheme cytochrome c family protein